jgi:hypothetical protein
MCKTDLRTCFHCDGYNYQYKTYLERNNNELCFWYEYVDRHLEELIPLCQIEITLRELGKKERL